MNLHSTTLEQTTAINQNVHQKEKMLNCILLQ